MDKMTLAAQLYTLREHLKTPEDIKKSLKRVKQMGYNAVQVSGVGPISPESLKGITDELGLRICATHISYDRLKQDLDSVLREHKMWNCHYVGLGSMPEKFRENKDGYLAFIKELNEIAKRIHNEGFQFVYHNHNFEFEKFDGITGYELLLNNTDTEAFGFEMDTYWVQAGGGNPVEWINRLEGRMEVVHFKDMTVKGYTSLFAEIGEGNLNWPAIIDACRKTGVKWYAVEQDICRRDPFDSLKISFEYLKNYFINSVD